MPPNDDDGFALIAKIAHSKSGAGRSGLYRWMHANHDRFAELLADNRANWTDLTEGFIQKLGLCALGTKPETVRHMWWRVRRAVARSRAKRRPSAPPAVAVIAPPPRPLKPAPAAVAVSACGESDALRRLRADIDHRSGRRS